MTGKYKLGGISEIAKNKLLGYPSLVVGGFGVVVLLLISFVPDIV
jgi:ABC-type phosphate transport system permease subunit